jgi:hypothetical protein
MRAVYREEAARARAGTADPAPRGRGADKKMAAVEWAIEPSVNHAASGVAQGGQGVRRACLNYG